MIIKRYERGNILLWVCCDGGVLGVGMRVYCVGIMFDRDIDFYYYVWLVWVCLWICVVFVIIEIMWFDNSRLGIFLVYFWVWDMLKDLWVSGGICDVWWKVVREMFVVVFYLMIVFILSVVVY